MDLNMAEYDVKVVLWVGVEAEDETSAMEIAASRLYQHQYDKKLYMYGRIEKAKPTNVMLLEGIHFNKHGEIVQ